MLILFPRRSLGTRCLANAACLFRCSLPRRRWAEVGPRSSLTLNEAEPGNKGELSILCPGWWNQRDSGQGRKRDCP